MKSIKIKIPDYFDEIFEDLISILINIPHIDDQNRIKDKFLREFNNLWNQLRSLFYDKDLNLK